MSLQSPHKGVVPFVTATLAIAAVLTMGAVDTFASGPRFGPWFIGLAAIVVIAAAGASLSRLIGDAGPGEPPAGSPGGSGADERSEGPPTPTCPARPQGEPPRGRCEHAMRLFLVGYILVAGAMAARAALVPASFGEFGRYRGQAVRDAMSATVPHHQGKTVCSTCHATEAALHAKDMHGKIECESCHGPGDRHVTRHQGQTAKGSRATGHDLLRIPKAKEACLWCHRRLAARPRTFPQVDPVEHYKFLSVKDETLLCTNCHSPHEPLFLSKPLFEARLHPVIQQCRDCHARPVASDAKRPDNHPVVFECKYCHPAIAADFATKKHSKMDCNKCHLFHKESDEAGRIIRNRNPEFCLLCHRESKFRGPGAPPLVAWPSHRDDISKKAKDKVCVDCHLGEKVHSSTAELTKPTVPVKEKQ